MATNDKREILNTIPHYTDSRFNKEQTVFGQETKGISYDYNDRLWEWDRKKSDDAYKHAANIGAPVRSCLYYEAYLSHYFGKPVEIYHIVAGVNRGNGYPYCVFGYKFI